MERGTGLEPATICLEGRDSTTELPPLIPAIRRSDKYSQPFSRTPYPLHSLRTFLSSELPAANHNARRKLSQRVRVIELIDRSPRCVLSRASRDSTSCRRKTLHLSRFAMRRRTTLFSLPSDLNPARRRRAATICLLGRQRPACRQADSTTELAPLIPSYFRPHLPDLNGWSLGPGLNR